MVDVSLISPTATSDLSAAALINDPSIVLAHSRRPAILTYASTLTNTASTFVALPLHVLGWKKESEVLEIKIFEGVEFAKGWKNIPNAVRVVVEADEKMHFYDVEVKIIARFGGLRYGRGIDSLCGPLNRSYQIRSLLPSHPLLHLLHHNLLLRFPSLRLPRLPPPNNLSVRTLANAPGIQIREEDNW